MRAATLLSLALLLAGCPDGLEKQSHVSKLRVLAVRADPAELIFQSGGALPSATLTALAVEPSGEPITLQFAVCTALTAAPSPALPCPGDAGLDLPDAGPSAGRLDLADPRILAFAAQVDAGAFDAGSILAALTEGVPVLVGLAASAPAPDGGLQRVDAFSTITLRTSERRPVNQNPALTALQLAPIPAAGDEPTAAYQDLSGDGSFGVARNAHVRLQPAVAPKGDPSEKYGFSFFATAGEISSLRSTDTTSTGQAAPTWVEWTAPDVPGQVRFWVVVRDGHGGTDWLERRAAVLP